MAMNICVMIVRQYVFFKKRTRANIFQSSMIKLFFWRSCINQLPWVIFLQSFLALKDLLFWKAIDLLSMSFEYSIIVGFEIILIEKADMLFNYLLNWVFGSKDINWYMYLFSSIDNVERKINNIIYSLRFT